MKRKDLLTLEDMSKKEIEQILKMGIKIKKRPSRYNNSLKGKTLAMIFDKPSTRTRVSFDVGIYQLGGHPIMMKGDECGLDERESTADIARTLSRFCDGIMIRTFEQKIIDDLATYASIPVINGLTDNYHPCQVLADAMTIYEQQKTLRGIKVAFIGDGNNIANSLIHLAEKTGLNLTVCTPKGYEPKKEVFNKTTSHNIAVTNNILEAVKGVDYIYTDAWASMGQEEEAAKRKKVFKSFQINQNVVSKAAKNVQILHCLPAHRGQEITDEVIDSKNSIVFDQAENRLHVQKAILLKLLG